VEGLDKERSFKMPGGTKKSHKKTWQDDQGPGRVWAFLTIVVSGQTLTESQTKKRENVQTTQTKRDVEPTTETKQCNNQNAVDQDSVAGTGIRDIFSKHASKRDSVAPESISINPAVSRWYL
jgi:hypothetical protein